MNYIKYYLYMLLKGGVKIVNTEWDKDGTVRITTENADGTTRTIVTEEGSPLMTGLEEAKSGGGAERKT